ncbi:MAG: indolepyruvate ferredoxin oxidoreductase subunit alpha [Candidatus Thorarchaeota archaeon]
MVEKKAEIESLFKKMLKDTEENAPKDTIYLEDIKTIGTLRVQWKICGILGYQIFEQDKVSFKFGEKLEKPDVSLVIRDIEIAIPFLKGELFEFDYGPAYGGNFKINQTIGWKEIELETGKKNVRINKPFATARFNKEKEYHPFVLSKIPVFRKLVTQRISEDDFGAYIPINKALGSYENQVIPLKVIKYFIDKASNIVKMTDCPCRTYHECKDHKRDLGCLHMGNDTLNFPAPHYRSNIISKEEALEHVILCIEDGLIPIIGRAMDEAEGFGIPDTGHLMSMCFCCPCCCIDGKIVTHASKGLTSLFKRMDGITVKVDEDLCVGCGECLDVCVFLGMQIIDDKAVVNQDNCLGCGRCESTCPNEAISITIADLSYVDKLIKDLESHVDVS